MKDVKKAWNFIKDLWSNKRTRSIVILGGYLIFMTIIVVMIRTNNDRVIDPPIKPIKTEYVDMINYEFEYTIDGVIIKGTHYNNEAIMTTSKDERFYLKDNTLYLIVDNKLEEAEDVYNLLNLEPSILGVLVKNVSPSYSTDYNDDSKKSEYITEKGTMIIYEKDNLVTEVQIENIKIIYTNHNKITSLNINFTK